MEKNTYRVPTKEEFDKILSCWKKIQEINNIKLDLDKLLSKSFDDTLQLLKEMTEAKK